MESNSKVVYTKFEHKGKLNDMDIADKIFNQLRKFKITDIILNMKEKEIITETPLSQKNCVLVGKELEKIKSVGKVKIKIMVDRICVIKPISKESKIRFKKNFKKEVLETFKGLQALSKKREGEIIEVRDVRRKKVKRTDFIKSIQISEGKITCELIEWVYHFPSKEWYSINPKHFDDEPMENRIIKIDKSTKGLTRTLKYKYK